MKKDVLAINSYAGSLLVAARNEKLKIRASMEDAGYGMPIQRANFPKLRFFEKAEAWPARQNLRNTIVIAHPPCACFSVQNKGSKEVKGINAPKFASTRLAIEYALSNHCAALCVESVIGALEGAREAHDEYARKYGYNIFRITQNALTFGVPQWRQRFWAIFIPETGIGRLAVYHDRRVTPLVEHLDKPVKKRDIFKYGQEGVAAQREKLREKGVSKSLIEGIFGGEYGYGPLQRVLKRALQLNASGRAAWDEASEYCIFGNKFSSHAMMLLDPNGYAGVVLAGSFFVTQGRALTVPEYKKVMGFPVDYVFPKGPFLNNFRTFLSRGVCPPVAQWVLRTARHAIGDLHEPPGFVLRAYIRPGETANLLVKRQELKKALRQLPLFSEYAI